MNSSPVVRFVVGVLFFCRVFHGSGLAEPSSLPYLDECQSTLTKAVATNDANLFKLSSEKLIAALYADPRNEAHKRIGELLVTFGIEAGITHMVDRMDKTESVWARQIPQEYPLATALVAFGRASVPSLLDAPSRRSLDAYRAMMLGSVLVGIVGSDEALKLVEAKMESVQDPGARAGLDLMRVWILDAGKTSIFLRIDRTQLPLPPSKPLISVSSVSVPPTILTPSNVPDPVQEDIDQTRGPAQKVHMPSELVHYENGGEQSSSRYTWVFLILGLTVASSVMIFLFRHRRK